MPKRKPSWMSAERWKKEKSSYYTGKYKKHAKKRQARSGVRTFCEPKTLL
jgi:hypothetical protein